MRSVCCQSLCTRTAVKDQPYCRAHRRLSRRAYPEGLRVVFAPTPVSAGLYTQRPQYGETGVVVSVNLGARRSTYLKGPAGGLLYVSWGGWVCGVSPLDLYMAP